MKSIRLPQARRHLGGTLLGFIFGLLVGLGIALAVAVYVTRVPVPFVERKLSRTPEQDAQETERNKGWNPNDMLGGQDTSSKQPVVPDQPPAPATAGTPDAGSAPATDPIGDLMRSKGAGEATGAAGGADTTAQAGGGDGSVYFVQAGAFRSSGDAETQRARLGMMGMTANVSTRDQDGTTMYRVRVGPFNDKAVADATREQLVVNGVDAVLVRLKP